MKKNWFLVKSKINSLDSFHILADIIINFQNVQIKLPKKYTLKLKNIEYKLKLISLLHDLKLKYNTLKRFFVFFQKY